MRGGPRGVKKTVTRTEKAVFEFTASELCKRLRLPDTARIFIKVPGSSESKGMLDELEIDDLGQSLLVDVEAIA
jgi:hypothetical protein